MVSCSIVIRTAIGNQENRAFFKKEILYVLIGTAERRTPDLVLRNIHLL